jgi:predicted dehydrogenase
MAMRLAVLGAGSIGRTLAAAWLTQDSLEGVGALARSRT